MGPMEKSLREAKQRILDNGWVKGYDGGPKEGWCAAAAIRNSPGDGGGKNIDLYPESWLFKEANGIRGEICDWNDDPARTKDEVLLAFGKAIEYAAVSHK